MCDVKNLRRYVSSVADTKDILKKRKEMDKLDLTNLNLKEDLKYASRKTLEEGIIKPRLVEIFNLVAKEVKESGFMGLTPAGVVIAGGGAETVGMVEVAKRVLSMPARVGEPKGLDGLIEEIQAPSFAAATGLILYAMTQGEGGTSGRLSMPQMPKFLSKLPIKGIGAKILKFIKSLLP